MLKAVLFDVDGTLVDSNEAHTAAWVQAFSEFNIAVDPDKVRRCIGMGGDKLMPTVIGMTADSPLGSRVSERRGEIFKTEFLPRLKPFRDAGKLVAAVKARGLAAVAASSAKKDELTGLLKVAGAESLMDATTSSDDAEESKPDPDIIIAALKRAGARAQEAVMIGDTPYDLEAASRAGVQMIAFRCGGWRDDRWRGAAEIYDGPWDLLARIDESLLGGLEGLRA